MAKEELLEEEYEEENILEAEDEDGNIIKLLFIDEVVYKGRKYCCFQKADPEPEEGADLIAIYELVGEGEDMQFLIVEDDQLLDEVFAEFCNQYEDFEDADEAKKLDS